jgi:hypothetical protein
LANTEEEIWNAVGLKEKIFPKNILINEISQLRECLILRSVHPNYTETPKKSPLLLLPQLPN